MRILLTVFLFIFSNWISAKEYKNKFFSFTLSDSWECVADGSNFICQDKLNKNDAFFAVVVKPRGAKDEAFLYKNQLRKMKTKTLPGGGVIATENPKLSMKRINGVSFAYIKADNLQIKGYHSHNLAAAKAESAYYFSFSYKKSKKAKYEKQIEQFLKTIKLSPGGTL